MTLHERIREERLPDRRMQEPGASTPKQRARSQPFFSGEGREEAQATGTTFEYAGFKGQTTPRLHHGELACNTGASSSRPEHSSMIPSNFRGFCKLDDRGPDPLEAPRLPLARPSPGSDSKAPSELPIDLPSAARLESGIAAFAAPVTILFRAATRSPRTLQHMHPLGIRIT